MKRLFSPDSWLVRTGQHGKVFAAFLLMGVSFCLLIAQAFSLWPGPLSQTILLASFAAWLFILLVLVRCPACGGKPMRKLLFKCDSVNFVQMLLRSECCPDCGDDGRGRTTDHDTK